MWKDGNFSIAPFFAGIWVELQFGELGGVGAADRRLGSYVVGMAGTLPSLESAEPLDWRPILAHISDAEMSPLVGLLVRVIEQQALVIERQAQRIAALEKEVARLGGPKKPTSNSKPSALSAPTPAPNPDGKRPGSAKRSKTSELEIHQDVAVPPKDPPSGSKLVRHEAFVVQDLIVRANNTRYLIEVWETPTGELVRGELPAGVRGHFGPQLQAFILQQHFAAHVPQSRLLEELGDFGIDISAGQINRLVTEQHDAFHAEKDALLPSALEYVEALAVDDSGAPHDGQYGSCLCLSTEFFTSFHSSDTKERAKFFDVLRCGHRDYILNVHAWQYAADQGLPAKVVALAQGDAPATLEQTFADERAWTANLDRLSITVAKHRQTLTEAALLGSAIAHGVPADLGIVSDGSPIYDIFVHGLCWIHQERNLAKLVPCGAEQNQAFEAVTAAVWQLYNDLKAYRSQPTPDRVEPLRSQFDALVNRSTGWAELDAALQRMAKKKDGLLRVLDRPALPLHTNTVERDFRDWATKRKISAGTRSESGRRCRDTFLSLKSTCRKLGVRFMTYLRDRLTKANEIPELAELARRQATNSEEI